MIIGINSLNFLIYFGLTSGIGFLLLWISKTVSHAFLLNSEKITEYECGFEPFDNATQQPFDVHFYIIGLLFLIFDIELIFLFPWSVEFYNINLPILWVGYLFILILTIGIIYEWKLNVIDWPYTQKDIKK